MSYHEDKNGRRRHYNGHHFIPDTDLILNPVRFGEGVSSKRHAMQLLQDLVDDIGEREYKAWWERCFEQDGKTGDSFTWFEIGIAALLALEHPESLECSCNGLTQTCDVCKSIAHVSTLPELES